MKYNIQNIAYYMMILISIAVSIAASVYYFRLDLEVSGMSNQLANYAAISKSVIPQEIIAQVESPVSLDDVRKYIEVIGDGYANFQYQISAGPDDNSFKHHSISIQFTTSDDRDVYSLIKKMQSGFSGFVIIDEIKLQRHGDEILAMVRAQHYGVAK